TAAIVDDLDLCRLLNPRGRRPNLGIGVFEIALEQMRWERVPPFSAHEGQHVQMELYVGRRDEARQLFETAQYSRLFSGRKLALLRFVEGTYEGKQLPSGCKLHVLYVPAVGADAESDVVDRILTALRDRAGFQEPLSDAYVRPGDRLVNTLRRFTEERPAESLLVVLDEADRFVEAQLEEYEQRREDCLTFRMRTDVETIRDVQGLPRVRFVFAGYRVTQTSEGAWANWGRVLTLQPLSHDEGRALVEGPLARLGIDGSGQADVIAWRCGYQPAVLLRFGEQLLRRLERTRPASARARVEVNEEE